jgi:uncharacterized membrane protein
MLVGTVVFSVGGLAWSTVVVVFFVSSSLLSHVSSERKRRVAADKFSKPGARDLFQTMANGGVGTLATLAYGISRGRQAWLHGARSSGPLPRRRRTPGRLRSARWRAATPD